MAPSRIPPWRTHPMSGSQGPGPGADDAARRACARDHRQSGYGPLRASLHTPLCRLLTDLQGPSGRQTDGATKEDIFSSILRSNESTLGSRDSSRSRRQSRVSREIVSSSKGALVFPVPRFPIEVLQIVVSLSFLPRNGKTDSQIDLQQSQRAPR